ncbi:MAG: hypothetical protein ACJ76Y_08150 [Thermoanaerobaculia bacterium]
MIFAEEPLSPAPASTSDSEYDFPVFKAFAAARQYASSLASREGQNSSTRKAPSLEALSSSGKALPERERCEALLAQCRDFRYSDPEKMVLSASLAVNLAERLTAKHGESAEWVDLEAQAWAELGNAYRVADDFVSAETALAHALKRSSQGNGEPLLLARLMDLTASLFVDRRRFKEAHSLLEYVYTIYQRHGDAHAAARTFISKGIASNLALEPGEAMGYLTEGLRQIKATRDPKLVLSALHGLLWCLVEAGRAAEASRFMEDVRPLYEAMGERFDRLPQLWLEGRIASHLGEDEKAERYLQLVCKGYRDSDIAYDVALVSLDLAALWLRQGRTAEIQSLLDDVIVILRARNLQREALSAFLMLKKAFESNKATVALLQTAADQLWRLERFPTRRAGLSS